MANGLASFAATDGKLLWRYGTESDRFGGNTANVPTPIVQDNFVFAAAGYGRGGGLVKLSSMQQGISAEEVYFVRDLTNRHGGVVLVGDFVYGDRDHAGLPWCANWKTGEIQWKKSKRTEGQGSASITYADGRLYMLYQNGVVALVEASPAAYREISTFRLPEPKEPCWSHPVVVGKQLLIRNQDTLICYDIQRQ